MYDQGTDFDTTSTARFSTEIDFPALQRLYRRPWFQRLWVIQEAALSKESLCLYGQSATPLLEVLIAARWLRHKRDLLPFSIDDERGIQNASLIWQYADREQGYYRQGTWIDLSLLVLLNNARGFLCIDPRDKVFGVLGIYRHMLNATTEQSNLLRTDYSKIWAEVMRNAARYAIEEREDLTALNCLYHRKNESLHVDGLPGWVPQWDVPWDAQQDPASFSGVYEACKPQFECDVRLLRTASSPDILILNGSLVDQVDRILTTFTREHIEQELVDVLLEVMDTTGHAEEFDAALADTLSTGIASSNGHTTITTPAKALDGLQAWLAIMTSKIADQVSVHSDLDADHHLRASAFGRMVKMQCSNRTLFYTKNGRYGLGPAVLTQGDFVAILDGSRWPFLLRPSTDHASHELVGPSYVHGIMYGEANEQLEPVGGVKRSISLV